VYLKKSPILTSRSEACRLIFRKLRIEELTKVDHRNLAGLLCSDFIILTIQSDVPFKVLFYQPLRTCCELLYIPDRELARKPPLTT